MWRSTRLVHGKVVSMKNGRFLGLMTLVLAAAFGCGEEAGVGTGGGTGGAIGGGAGGGFIEDDGGTDGGGGGPASGGDSFATATPIPLGEEKQGTIERPVGIADHYRLEGTAGEWIAIEAHYISGEYLIPFITLYDASMTPIARRESFLPTRLPTSGTYYITVAASSSSSTVQVSSGYRLLVATIPAVGAGLTRDPETGDDVASAVQLDLSEPVASGFEHPLLTGTARDGSDIDAFTFSLTEARSMWFDLVEDGPSGDGSTRSPTRMWVTDASGTTILARIDTATKRTFRPPLPAGDYVLWLEHSGAAGTNDFYAVRVGSGDPLGSAYTLESEANDTIASAQEVAIDDIFLNILGTLGHEDVDHYVFDAMANVYVYCRSGAEGSGVVGLTLTVFDADDVDGTAPLYVATEAADSPIRGYLPPRRAGGSCSG